MSCDVTASRKDYTTEICRCITFIVSQVRKGRNVETAFNQAVSSYGYAIAFNSKRAIERNLAKK